MLYFCTLFDSAYLSKGIAMYESLEKHCPSFHLYVFAIDDNCAKVMQHYKGSNITVVTLKEFENEDLLKIKPERTRAEYCWTCTSSAILYCLSNFNIDHCTYVDADICFFSDPKVLIDEMGNASISLTDHRFSHHFDEADRYGKYCVQFMTFKKDDKSLKALKWWVEKCLEWCYYRVEDGKFGDQKYLDDWTERFDGVHVLQNIGGGIASWNIQDYYLIRKSNHLWIKDQPANVKVVFYHFSNIQRFYNGVYVLPRSYLISSKNRKLLHRKYVKHIKRNSDRIIATFPDVDPDGCIVSFPTEVHTFRDKFYIFRELLFRAVRENKTKGFGYRLRLELAKGYYKFNYGITKRLKSFFIENIKKDKNPIDPLKDNKNYRLIKSIPSSYIIEKYQSELNVDVKRFFNDINIIYLYKEIGTGYCFYYPFIAGDGSLYHELQKIYGNNEELKWEHKLAKTFINPADKVLEIGCSDGFFLEVLNREGIETIGIDIDRAAVESATKKNINVINEIVEEHAVKNKECYDMVCSFQVMEHIPDVYNSIKASLQCLKKNGIFIMSVPNNNSYLKYIDNVLNYPPHHAGLWNKKSLQFLTKKMNLGKPEYYYEPIYNIDFYFREIKKIRQKKYGYRLGHMINNIERMTKTVWYKKLPGFRYDMTILAKFQKT